MTLESRHFTTRSLKEVSFRLLFHYLFASPLTLLLSTTHFHSNIGIVIASNAWSLAILLFVFFYFFIPLVFEREVKEREEIVTHVESLKHTKRKI